MDDVNGSTTSFFDTRPANGYDANDSPGLEVPDANGGATTPSRRKKWHLKQVARNVMIGQRFIGLSKTKLYSYKDLCSRCAHLDLEIDKFIIQDHSSDRSQQAYRSYLRPSRIQKTIGFPLGSGSGKFPIGTLEEIMQRGQDCPFCHLVVQALQDFDFYGASPEDEQMKKSRCYASWQVDGREVVRDHLGHVASLRPRTRRIQLHWNNERFQSSYLVLVAPESTRLPDSDKGPLWESETLFLGRNISTAGNNQALVKSWLDLCHDSHGPLCRIDRGPEFQAMITKAYFGVVDVHEMRLTSLPANEKYVALSYMWGKGERYTTTLKNIHEHQAYGGLEKKVARLPRVISDAIKLVRGLGERYIWIDSLCIVQDSPRSWKLNAAVMDQVYGNAHLTICAADGEGATAGLKALSSDERYTSQHTEECGKDIRLMVSHLAETYIKRSRWNTRAWTFQERLLSKRCLIFTESRVYFQCRSTAMSEDVVAEQKDAGWSIELVQAPLQMLLDLSTRAFWVYTKCVQLYTSRDLGRPSDILAAFNGMSNLIGTKMGYPLVFGLPASHFDLALLWEPNVGSELRVPKNDDEKAQFGGIEFPTWSWCGWKGAAMEYRQDTIAGCLANVHQWLIERTWISWYIRDGHGNLRPIWDSSTVTQQEPDTEWRWRGYGSKRSLGEAHSDSYGRVLPTELYEFERSTFNRTLPEYPYHVGIAPTHSKLDKPSPDERFLQFWTWSAYLRLIPHDQSSTVELGEGLSRYDIADYTGDWCGTIVLDQSWAKYEEPGSEHEFLAISDAKDFSKEENDVWTYYIPKEKQQSEWDLYYVLLVTRRGGTAGTARRKGLGKVFKEAFNNSCLPGKEWKEIILE